MSRPSPTTSAVRQPEALTSWRPAVLWVAALAATVGLLVLIAGPGALALGKGSWMVSFGAVAVDGMVYASVGALLALRRPDNRIGWLLLIDGVLVPATFLGFVLGANRTVSSGAADPLAGLASLAGSMLIFPTIILAGPGLALLFPDGRLPSREWHWPVGILVAFYVGCAMLFLGEPGPLGNSLGNNPLGGIWPWFGHDIATAALGTVALTLPASLALAIVAVAVRFRRSHDLERTQLKWFIAANLLFGGFILASFADGATEPTVFDILAFVSLSLPPISIGLAVMRYRLYDIDRLISRTLSWTASTVILVVVFSTAVVALQSALSGVTQGQTLAVAASTLLAFAIFQPLRRRVQAAVDRRFDRARYNAQRTTDQFAGQIRSEVDLATIELGLVRTAEQSVRPIRASVWLRGGNLG